MFYIVKSNDSDSNEIIIYLSLHTKELLVVMNSKALK